MVKTREYWKKLSLHKVEIVKRLMAQKEWEVAGEYMGYALECALKAVTCKTLGIDRYPPLKLSREGGKNSAEISGFKTHEFDALIVLCGLSEKLDSNFELSQFTSSYAGDWESRRYEIVADFYDEKTIVDLAKFLYDSEESILNKLDREGLW